MEGSSCRPPPHFSANGNNGDKGWEEEIIISFGSLGLCKNGTLISQPSMMQQMKNAVSCSSSSLPGNGPSIQDDVTDDSEKLTATKVSMEGDCSSYGIEIDELSGSLDMEWPSASSVHRENIWGQPNIYGARGTSYGSPRGQTCAGYIYEDSSIQHPAASDWKYQSDVCYSGNVMMNGLRNCSAVMGRKFNCKQLTQVRNFGCYLNNNTCSSTHFSYQDVMEDEVPQISSLQQGNNILVMARTRDDSEWLQKVLEPGDYILTQIILNGLLDSIFQLMIDDNGHHVFGMLVEKCHINQLRSIVSKAHSEPDTFICIAFIDKGSRSIQRLIKRLKKTAMAHIITSILSRNSYELLTHKIGSHVIRQCFLILGEKPNLVLYDTIFNRLLDLATDPVGCISLNSCIDSITGPRRRKILDTLAAHSLFLSNDPSGNFVVQHMLNVNNEDITEEILNRLQGNFEQLAQKRGGSHVIEKCMRSSIRGLNLVVTELVMNQKALSRLAKDLFGNYVIQTALKETKMKDQKLYQELVEALRPYCSYLLCKTRGRHVAELIRQDLKLHKA